MPSWEGTISQIFAAQYIRLVVQVSRGAIRKLSSWSVLHIVQFFRCYSQAIYLSGECMALLDTVKTLPKSIIVVIVGGAAALTTLAYLALMASGFDASILNTIRTEIYGQSGYQLSLTYRPVGIALFSILMGLAITALAAILEWRLKGVAEPITTAESIAAQARQSEALKKVGASFGGELASVLALLRAHIASNETYSKALTNAQARLSNLTEPEQVSVIVKLLVAENERMRRVTLDLRGKLEQSQTQIESLRTNLQAAEVRGMKDPLTNVGNRRCFDETLRKELAVAAESGEPVSLIMCDIDHFKKVNDEHGHAVGDEVLKMFAAVIQQTVRDGDTAARFGGEEFAIILPGTPQSGALALAERIRSRFEAKRLTIRSSNKMLGQLTASFGVAERRNTEAGSDLIERADKKLYEAKNSGRNRVA